MPRICRKMEELASTFVFNLCGHFFIEHDNIKSFFREIAKGKFLHQIGINRRKCFFTQGNFRAFPMRPDDFVAFFCFFFHLQDQFQRILQIGIIKTNQFTGSNRNTGPQGSMGSKIPGKTDYFGLYSLCASFPATFPQNHLWNHHLQK